MAELKIQHEESRSVLFRGLLCSYLRLCYLFLIFLCLCTKPARYFLDVYSMNARVKVDLEEVGDSPALFHYPLALLVAHMTFF